MTTDTWLTPDEVEQLTARKRWTAQCRALSQMGIRFTPNHAGRPLVERAAVVSAPTKPRKKAAPNWSKLDGKAA